MTNSNIDVETISIEIPKDDAKRLWFLLLDVQMNDRTRITAMHTTDPKLMGISEIQKRRAMASILDEINMVQNIMCSIKSKLE